MCFGAEQTMLLKISPHFTPEGVQPAYPHVGRVLVAGRLSVFGPDASRCDVGRAVGVEVEAEWEAFLVLYICTEVVLQL